MPLAADHILDHPEDYYKEAGTSRLHTKNNFNPFDVKENELIFVKTDFIYCKLFQLFHLSKISKKFNLITGISDYQLKKNDYETILNHPKLNKWFCANPPDVQDSRIIPIPIGFTEPDRPCGKQDALKQQCKKRLQFGQKEDLIFLPYHNFKTNTDRKETYNYLKTLPFVHAATEKQDFKEYLDTISKYKFAISLEGNGPDAHRNYEIMLMNSIPVGIKNVISSMFVYHNLEGIFLNSWKELDSSYFKKICNKDYSLDNNLDFLSLQRNIDFVRNAILEDK
jgi:hypothetical protein